MKKTLSLILALLMTASCASTIFADDEVEATAAIAEDAAVEEEAVVEDATEYDLAIQFLQNYKIMQGKEDGLLHAEDGVKRYEMALFAGRVSTGWVKDTQWEDGTANNSQFTDLAGTGAENVLGAVSYVNQKGIIEGYPDGSFKPEQGVTYREALTMAVRTLGYQGLDYPWEYIEKAVSLGLTDGITGVAYTDAVNRGVVAQIVYNMLFATTREGDTLAMRSFGVEFGWQNIVITADTRGVFEAGAKKTAKGVSFKVVNADGTLDDTTYYVDEDYELGRVYNALFEIDADDEFVTLIGASAYVPEIIENKGLTDDEGVAYDDVYAIQTYLEDYTLVDKYSSKILSNSGKLNNEIIIADAYNKATVIEVKADADTPYAIDWLTGDILVQVKDEDGEYVAGEYDVAWYYNSKLEQYYRYSDKAVKGEEDIVIGIELMDEDDVEDIQKAIKAALEVEKEVDSFKVGVGEISKAAYSTLEAYDLNDDGKADYGVYEAYRFGKFSTDVIKVCDCGDQPSYLLQSLNLAVVSDTYEKRSATCDHIGTDYAVFAEGYEPCVDEDGNYVAGYVIYGVNRSTNEIKIVKEIKALGENEDADSYVATGIVRGYNLAKNTVTIDNEVLSVKYDNFDGTAFVGLTENSDKKGEYTDYFDRLFNQFVEYIVVDGVVVYIDVKGAKNDEYLVVESYYGIDNENYIVVAGYSTTDLKYDTFRIGSFNGWKHGDFFFNEDAIEDEFEKGCVYQIASHDAENDIYYVNSLSYYSDKQFGTESVVDVDVDNITVTFDDNYRVVTNNDDAEKSYTKRMSSSDKYIIIGDPETKLDNYMPIYVYEGKVPTDLAAADKWTVTGDLLVSKDDNKTLIIVNPTALNGFNKDTAETGYVVVIDNKITVRNYNGYGEEYYIYGATQNTVEVFNLLNAKEDEIRVNINLELEEGKIYRTISNAIVDDADLDWGEFITDMDRLGYEDDDTDSAKYVTEEITFVKKWLKEETFSEEVISGLYNFNGAYEDLIGDYIIKAVEVDEDDCVLSISSFDKDAWADIEEEEELTINSIPAFLIYEVSSEKAIVYVNVTAANTTSVEEGTATTVKDLIVPSAVVDDDDTVNLEATVDVEYTTVGKTVTATVNALTLTFTGDLTADTHALIDVDQFSFGTEGDCDWEKWHTSVDGVRVPGSIDSETYDNHDDEEWYCELIKAVTVAVDDVVVTENVTRIVVDFTDGYGRDFEIIVGVQLVEDEVNVWFAEVSPKSSIDGVELALTAE